MREVFYKIKESRIAIGIGMFVLGIIAGALFYPTKRQEERLAYRYEQQISVLKHEYEQEIKRITDAFSQTIKETKDKLLESEKKVSSLMTHVRELKSRQKISRYKLVHPDGTVEEKEFTETQTEESSKFIRRIKEQFNTRIAELEQRWSDIHRERVVEMKREFDKKEREYVERITSLEREKKTIVNDRRFGLEIGLLSDRYYGHGTMDLIGPFFVGIHGDIDRNHTYNLGLGLGIRF